MVNSGRVVGGRYELLDRIGRGGMAEVFRAFDRVLERRVAVKVLTVDGAEDETLFDRFRREARTAASLTHPNVVSVYDTGIDDDVHYIVMELVEGPSLVDVLRREGPLEVPRALEVIRPVANALAAAHAQGLVHRDVKPGNILFDRTGNPKISDFGIARVVSAATQTSAVYGSALYMAPEQARGATVDGRADIYALGCVLYEMLTGHPPFVGDAALAVVYQHLNASPEPPSRLRPNIPTVLDAIVLRALAKDPAERYPQMDDFRGDLERFAAGLPPLTAAGPDLERTRRLGGPAETAVLGGMAAGADPTALIRPPSVVTHEEEVLAPPPQRSQAVAWIIMAVVVLILAALATYLVFALTRAEEPPPLPVPPPPAPSVTPTPPRQTPRPKAKATSPRPSSPSPSPSPSPTPTASPTLSP